MLQPQSNGRTICLSFWRRFLLFFILRSEAACPRGSGSIRLPEQKWLKYCLGLPLSSKLVYTILHGVVAYPPRVWRHYRSSMETTVFWHYLFVLNGGSRYSARERGEISQATGTKVCVLPTKYLMTRFIHIHWNGCTLFIWLWCEHNVRADAARLWIHCKAVAWKYEQWMWEMAPTIFIHTHQQLFNEWGGLTSLLSAVSSGWMFKEILWTFKICGHAEIERTLQAQWMKAIV